LVGILTGQLSNEIPVPGYKWSRAFYRPFTIDHQIGEQTSQRRSNWQSANEYAAGGYAQPNVEIIHGRLARRVQAQQSRLQHTGSLTDASRSPTFVTKTTKTKTL
jgi:hypothetical protein